MSKLSYKSLFIILFFLLIGIIVLAKFVLPNNKVSAAWWNDGWNYRKAINIGNTSGSIINNQRVKIVVDTSALITAGKMQSDCDDIRITDINGNLLDHWDTGCNTTTTNIYFKSNPIPTSGATIYFYYGSSSANNVEKILGTVENPGTSCLMMKDQGSVTTNGTYYIVPGGNDVDRQFVYCDQTTDGGGWVLIMNQKSNTGGFFLNSTQAQSYNESNPTADRYSILGKLGKFKDNGIFTFKMNWPPLGTTKNIWSQTSNPISEAIAGYTAITIEQTVNSWGGIALSSTSGSTFIDGSPGAGTWYYAIASYAIYDIGIPAYNPATTQTQLWVKGNDTMNNVSIGTPQPEEAGGGPIAYWKFDEGVGTTAYDSTTNKNNGLLSGTTLPTWQNENQCISGKCVSFNGTNNYLQLPTINNIKSISMWVYITPKDDGAWHYLLDARNGSSNGWFAFQTSTIMVGSDWNKMYVNGVSKAISISNIPLNQWVHLYIENINNFSDDINFMSRLSNSEFLSGKIDEVKFYSYARTTDQIKLDYNSRGTNKGTTANLGSADSSNNLANGLMAYWKFDEGVGTSTLDSSGNNNSISLTSTTWSAGKFGIGLTFNGGDSYGNAGSDAKFNFSSGDFTLSTWVKETNSDYNRKIIYKGEPYCDTCMGGYVISTNAGVPDFGINLSTASGDSYSVYNNSITINDGKWHLVLAQRIGDQIKLFVDGNLVGTTDLPVGAIIQNGNYLTISGSGYGFNGYIDEVRIYNRALSPTEVTQLYEYAPGPVGYWDFNDGSGNTVADKSGNNNNGTWSGTGSHWTQGKIGSAGNFNGSNDFVGIGKTLISNTSTFTVSGWVYPKTNSFHVGFFGQNDCFEFGFGSSGNISLYTTGGSLNYLPSTVVNSWNYYTVTWDKIAMSLFINGVKVATQAVSTFVNSSYNFNIGGGGIWDAAGNFLNGYIDEVKIYNYVRTQKQIAEDMNAGRSTLSTKSMLVHYKFDEGYGTTVNNFGNAGIGLSGVFGTGNSAPTWSNEGKSNKSLRFIGVGSTLNYLENPSNNDVFNLTNNLSFSIWVKPISVTAYSARYIFTHSSQFGPFLSNDGTFRMMLRGSDWTYYNPNSQAVIPFNQWSHLAGTFKDGTINFYLNGKFINSSTIPVTNLLDTTSDSLTIGSNSSYQYPFDGLIDEIKIYNYALTAEEIKQDYNQGSTFQMGSTTQTISNTTTSLEYCIPGDTSFCASPVAEWKMDEGSGTSINDTSGNNNTGNFGTGNSAPTWTQGKIGSATNFNGSNSFIDAGNSLNVGSSISIEAWVYPRSATNNPAIISKNWTEWTLSLENPGKLRFESTNINQFSKSTIPLNQWSHISVTYDGNKVSFYINGIGDTVIADTDGLVSGSSNINIGRKSVENAYYFTGKIDHVKIYNYARTPAQIVYDYNKGAPVGWWKLDECQGNIAYDWSGIGNTGTINIGPSGTQTSLGTCQVGTSSAWTAGAVGKVNSSLNFDGNDDYIGSLKNALTTNTNSETISAWIKPSNLLGSNYIFIQNGPTLFYLSNDKLIGGIYNGSWTMITSINSITANNWSHVSMTYDGANIKLYINGKLDTTTAKTGNLSGISSCVEIGRFNGGDCINGISSYFQGQIDDVRLYNYALTGEQIKQVYNGGAVSFN